MLFQSRIDFYSVGHVFFVSQPMLGETEKQLAENSNRFGAWYMGTAGLESYEVIDLGKTYIECNKHNLWLMLNPWTEAADGSWGFNQTVTNPAPSWPKKLVDPETPRKDPNWPTSDGKRFKVKPSTITGLWIIIRNSLYFAGFEAGTGDPIFVRFLFGRVSAHLYLTRAQAFAASVPIIKFYKRPDIAVDVVQI
jgi:hypothetical protein